MTDQTATERLRELLDGRGVEYETRSEQMTGIEHVIWHPNEYSQWDWNKEFGEGWLSGWQQGVTPEQAVAATLGSGKLTAEQVRKAIFDTSAYASYDGSRYYADGISMQAIADELNAALTEGEGE